MDDPTRREREGWGGPASTPQEPDQALGDAAVDGASEASFPASDPPAWMGMRVGGPRPRSKTAYSDRSPGALPDDVNQITPLL